MTSPDPDASDRAPVVYQHVLPPLDPAWEDYPALPQLEASGHWVPIRDTGDPLVRLDEEFHCTAAQWRRRWPGTSPHTYARQAVADALAAATANLPPGLGLAVLDAHRSGETQRFLHQRAYAGTGLAPGFVADPDNAGIDPPHTTGAAVDVTLTWSGEPLALGTAPGEYVDTSALNALEHTPGPGRALRRVLYHTMVDAGFRGIREEWWHYSLGNQEWAYQLGMALAPCGAIDRPTEHAGQR